MRKRVLLCFHALVTRSNHRLAEELSKDPDIDLHIVAPTWWPEEARVVYQEVQNPTNYRVRELPMLYVSQPQPNLFAYRKGLGQALRDLQPDILDFYEEPFSLAMGQALLLRARYAPQSRLLFYSAQNIYKQYPFPFRWFEQRAFRAAAGAYVCCTEAGQVLQAKGYRGDLRNIPLGVDSQAFVPVSAAERTALREEIGIGANDPVIGYLGRLHWEKGIAVLLEAAQKVPEAHLLLVGDGPHRAAIVAQIERAGLTQRTHLTGAINRLAVPRYLGSMDCLVVPSLTTPRWKEQFGRIIVEAFLCGIPVIGSSCGSIPEVVGETGIIVPEGDAEALGAAITTLLGDPVQQSQLSAAARKRAQQQYTWEHVAEQRLQLYRDIMDHG